jgi:anti-sigma B factor antagonist
MELTTTQFKHCDLVSVKGRIDSATAPQLADALDAIKTAGRFRIVVDMSGVDFISSAGLRVLIATQKECKRYNRGEVSLAAVQPKVQSALELAGFDALFKIHKDTLSAVGSI